MFVPSEYRPTDPRWARETVRAFPLALLVTNGVDGPFATHLPVIPADAEFDRGTGETGLVGVDLLGHMNRMNPHWAVIQTAATSLLIFQGANGYVSPTVYRTTPAAPTWNFVSVHVHGVPEPIEAGGDTLAVVQATVRAYERDHGTGWDMTDSVGYFAQIVRGVGAFRFRVTTAEAMFKLSQDKPEPLRQAVAEAFDATAPDCPRGVADAMYRYGGTPAPVAPGHGPSASVTASDGQE
jgi:transcriptional regulator